MKGQTTEWEEVFVSPMSDKGVVYRLHKELLHLNNKQQKKLKMIQVFEHSYTTGENLN